MGEQPKQSGGVTIKLGFPYLLTLILVVAKLAGVFTYSWWWVFLPVIVLWTFIATLILLAFIALCLEQ
jgi:hypothetical protein